MNILIDCGTHLGEGLEELSRMFKIDDRWEIYSFEANPITFDLMSKLLTEGKFPENSIWNQNKRIIRFNQAVYMKNGTIDFYCAQPIVPIDPDIEVINYLSEHDKAFRRGEYVINHETTGLSIDGGSSVYGKKMETYLTAKGSPYQKIIKWDKKISIPSLNISRFVNGLNSNGKIYLKLDIEGSEYVVLWSLIMTGRMRKIDVVIVEWHDFSKTIFRIQKKLIKLIAGLYRVKLLDWK